MDLVTRYWSLVAMLRRAHGKFCIFCKHEPYCWGNLENLYENILRNCKNDYIRVIVTKLLEIEKYASFKDLKEIIETPSDLINMIFKKIKYP